MAKTRSTTPSSLQAAAITLEEKGGTNSLLYNTQVIDYLTNSTQAGNTNLAWHYYGKIPELHYTVRYIANALSVATLYVGETDPSGGEPKRIKSGPAFDLMKNFAGGYAGQSELLDRLAIHLSVAGDSVLIGPRDGENSLQAPFDQWRTYSTEEVSARNGKIYLKLPGNAKEIQIPDSSMPIRIWRPDARFWWNAESPVKASFSVLKELDLLDSHVHATAVSRLAGAGLLGIPEELDLPSSEMEIEGTEIDKFVAMLTEVMGLAIKNRESAAALVPIILRGPADYISKIQHFDFSTAFSEQVPELREGAIRRLALGMDVPPEILLGSGSSTSWSAWQTDESTLRVHLVPMLQLIASSLTVGWLRPTLESLPLSQSEKDNIPNLVIGFDVSNLKIRQDVAGDAESLYDRFEIDAEALRMALGYSDNDVPDNEEVAKQILFKLVSGTPEQMAYAINGLRDNFGITKLPKAEAPTPEGGTPGPEAGAAKSPPAPETATDVSKLPGDRSQEKQLGPPQVPKIVDPSNNEVK